MARTQIGQDRTQAGTRTAVQREIIPYGDFESAPPFTAATISAAGGGRYIDGTAAGSLTNDNYGWSITNITGSGSAQFDNSTSHTGSNSLKVSTTATASNTIVSWRVQSFAANPVITKMLNKYAIEVIPSKNYQVTYWMKTTVNSGSGGTGAVMRITEWTATGTQIGSFANAAVPGTTAWTQYSFNRTTGATSVFWVPQCTLTFASGSTQMDAWFDTITITGDWGRSTA